MERYSAIGALFASHAAALATSVVLCLCVVDLLGVNRGEVTRLWIFLAVFIQLVCAESIITRWGEATASLTLAAVCVQTIVTVTTDSVMREQAARLGVLVRSEDGIAAAGKLIEEAAAR